MSRTTELNNKGTEENARSAAKRVLTGRGANKKRQEEQGWNAGGKVPPHKLGKRGPHRGEKKGKLTTGGVSHYLQRKGLTKKGLKMERRGKGAKRATGQTEEKRNVRKTKNPCTIREGSLPAVENSSQSG